MERWATQSPASEGGYSWLPEAFDPTYWSISKELPSLSLQ